MEDWGTEDYTATRADSLFVPAGPADYGVSLLGETAVDRDAARRRGGRPPSSYPDDGCDCSHCLGELRAMAAEGRPAANYPAAELDEWEGAPPPRRGPGPSACGQRGRRPLYGAKTREGYVPGAPATVNAHSATNQAVVSARRGGEDPYAADWDERPAHYNPAAGPAWAHLVVPEAAHAGGPPAFPLVREGFAGGGAGGGGSGGGGSSSGGREEELRLQYAKVFLLVLLVVMLAFALAAGASLARGLRENSEALALLSAFAAGQRSRDKAAN